MFGIIRRSMSNNTGKTGKTRVRMLETIIDNPAGFQAANMRVISSSPGPTAKASLTFDHSDLTTKVLVCHPEHSRVKIDVWYDTLSTIGYIHGKDLDPLVVRYSVFGTKRPVIIRK